MKVKNLNASSLKTRKLIRQSLTDIIKENGGVSNVSVTALVKCAQINRSTFYTHYDSILQVANELVDENIDAYFDQLELQSVEEIKTLFYQVYQQLDDHFHRLMGADPGVSIPELVKQLETENTVVDAMLLRSAQRMGERAFEKILPVIRDDPTILDKEGLALELNVIINGMLMEILHYIQGDLETSPQHMEECGTALITDIINRRRSSD